MIKVILKQYDEIIIDNIYHDTGNIDNHKCFKHKTLNYINLNIEKIKCNCNEITFVKTNHTNCLKDINTLLQFVDLFLGANFNMLHNVSNQKNKVAIAQKLFPITDRMINFPANKNSRYYNTYSISFFTKKG